MEEARPSVDLVVDRSPTPEYIDKTPSAKCKKRKLDKNSSTEDATEKLVQEAQVALDAIKSRQLVHSDMFDDFGKLVSSELRNLKKKFILKRVKREILQAINNAQDDDDDD